MQKLAAYNMAISIIVSTYNQPDALRMVLLALADQNSTDFEVIIVDDGSNDTTKHLIETLQNQVKYNINHVWQEHDGFRVATIRNKGVAKAEGDYLVFLDGDSIPSRSFVKKHQQLAEKNYFVSGNRLLLSRDFTKQVLKQRFLVQRWNFSHWLYAFCRGWINRLTPVLLLGKLFLRYRLCTKWQGAKTCNLGIWKQDFLAVNGFDESYLSLKPH